jgi:hypothetical protein
MLAGTDLNDPCDPNHECAACLAIRPPIPTPSPKAMPTPIATHTILPIVAPLPTQIPTPALAATPTPEESGFEGVFAVAGLLAIAYLVLKWKKK